MDGKISFLGWVGDPQLYSRYLLSADICVAPEPRNDYNDHSTFLKILEYMALGKPIVAFDLTETRRSAEGAALYARPNDVHDFAEKLASLMDSPALRKAMAERGRVRVNGHLAWRYSRPRLLAVYEKVLTGSGKALSLRMHEEQHSESDPNIAAASPDTHDVVHKI